MRKKSDILREIMEVGIVPVIRANSAEEALQVVDAIKNGGVSTLEITMTVPGAVKVIEELTRRIGKDTVVGAGTILDPETARICILAGAQYLVCPSLNLETIALCRRYDIPVFPGALTPTEVITAWQAGADMVKVFPCNAVGGASYIKALKAPLPQVDLIPTGGVSLKTAADFIKAGSSALGVGADLVDLAALRAGNAAQITENARRFVEIIREARQS